MTFLAIYYCIGLLINKRDGNNFVSYFTFNRIFVSLLQKRGWNPSNPPPLYPPLKKYFVVTDYYFTGNQVASSKADKGPQ